MNTTINNQLSDSSKVWVYQSNRPFSESEMPVLRDKIKGFVTQWTAHKEEVSGAGDILYDRFVVLMADESQVGVSGCSIDSSVNFMRALGSEFNVNFFDRWCIAYKQGEEVKACSRSEFEKLVENNLVNDETIVFNNLVQTKKEFERNWEIAFKNSWLKTLNAADSTFSLVL